MLFLVPLPLGGVRGGPMTPIRFVVLGEASTWWEIEIEC